MHNFILFDKAVYWSCFNEESIGTIRSSWHVVVVEKFHKNVLTRGQIPYFYELKLSLLMHNFILFDKVVYWSMRASMRNRLVPSAALSTL